MVHYTHGITLHIMVSIPLFTLYQVAHLTTTTWYKGPSIWMRPPETTSIPSGPSESLWRPLEVVGLRPLLGYMYTLYITYARADDLSQTKEGPQKGVLCTKRGVLRGPKRSKGAHSGSHLEGSIQSGLIPDTHEIHTYG